MTTRAEQVYKDIIAYRPRNLRTDEDYSRGHPKTPLTIIAAALSAEKQDALEEAAKVIESFTDRSFRISDMTNAIRALATSEEEVK